MEEKSEIQVTGIEHLGLAPKNPEKASWFFEQALGLPALHQELVEAQQVETLIFGSSQECQQPDAGRGTSRRKNKLEILKALGSGGPVSQFLDKRGGGIHHLALSVRNLPEVIRILKARGVRMIHDTPVPGVEGTEIAFVHPESSGGILIELVNEN